MSQHKPPMRLPQFHMDIEHVHACLAEGFCPAGHKLSHGGGRWGSCDRCATLWTVTVPGYTYRRYGTTDGCWHVSGLGEFFTYEFSMERR